MYDVQLSKCLKGEEMILKLLTWKIEQKLVLFFFFWIEHQNKNKFRVLRIFFSIYKYCDIYCAINEFTILLEVEMYI